MWRTIGMLGGAIMLLSAPISIHAQTLGARPAVQENETILRVRGEGEVSVDPEVLELGVGVTTTAKTSLEALALNNERSEKLVKRISELGIPAKDIRLQIWQSSRSMPRTVTMTLTATRLQVGLQSTH